MTLATPNPLGSAPSEPQTFDMNLGPSEVLPGVMGNPKPETETSSTKIESKPADPAPISTKAPESSAPTTPSAPSAASGVATATPASATSSDPATEPAKPKFKIGDEEYDPDQLVHQVKTLRGRYRAVDERDRQLQQERLEFERQRLEFERQRSSNLDPGTKPASTKADVKAEPRGQQEQPQSAAEKYRVFEILREKHGDAVAYEYLESQNEKALGSKLKALKDEIVSENEKRFGPALELNKEMERVAEYRDLLNTVSAFKNPDGSPAYPELTDKVAMREIRRMWDSMQLPEEMLRSVKGFHIAVATYRDAKIRSAARTAAKTDTSVVPTPPPQPASPVVSGAGSAPQRGSQTPAATETTAQQILKADLRVDPVFGFSRNR